MEIKNYCFNPVLKLKCSWYKLVRLGQVKHYVVSMNILLQFILARYFCPSAGIEGYIHLILGVMGLPASVVLDNCAASTGKCQNISIKSCM